MASGTELPQGFEDSSPFVEEWGKLETAHLMASGRDVVSEDVAMTSRQQHGLKGGGVKQLHLGGNELLIRFRHQMIEAWLNDLAPGAPESQDRHQTC